MADTFDPYYLWLAIPPVEQPPNHYRLIGVKTLEANLDAISHACDQRMAHLRTFQCGKHAAASQKLLNEISATSVVLLNADKKSVYDEQLRRQLAPHNVNPQPKSLPKAKSLPVAAKLSAKPAPQSSMPATLPMRAAPVVASAPEPVAKVLWQQPLVLVSAGGGLALLAAAAIGGVLFFVGGGGQTNPTSKDIVQRPATIAPAGKAPSVAKPKPATQQAPRQNEAIETHKSPSVGIPSTSPTGSESEIPPVPEVTPSPAGSPTPSGENIASPNKLDGGYAVRLRGGAHLDIAGTTDKAMLGRPFTVEVFARWSLDATGQHLLGNLPHGTLARKSDELHGWGLMLFKTGMPSCLLTYNDPTRGSQVSERPKLPNDSDWHHVAVSGSASEVRVFVDGQLLLTQPIAPPPATDRGSNIYVGSPPSSDTAANVFRDIRGLRLSTNNRYTDSFTPPGKLEQDGDTLVLLDFSKISPRIVYDLTGKGRHGQINNTEWIDVVSGNPVDTSGTLALAPGSESEPVAGNEESVATPKETTGTTNTGAARIKVPDAAAQKKAKDELREILKADFEKALKPDAKLSLSNKLQRLAKETPDDPAARYVLLNDAFQLAVEASQAQLAFTLADEIASEFEVEAWQLKGEALKVLSPLARTPAERQQVAEAALKIADEAVAQANYAMADQLLKIAATRVVDPKLKTTIMVRAKEIDDLQKQAKLAKLAEERLKTDPDNPAANLAYGKYLCYLRGQWEQGLPHLAKGDDAALKAAATGDIAAPATPEKQVALGDLWWDAAQANKTADKHGLLARAGYWYGQALSGTTGISKARLEKRLVEIKESVPASTVAANAIKSKAINLIALIDPKEDTVKGEWLIERGALVCATQHFVPKLYLPYIPPEEYDLKVVFSQPKIRHDVGIILPRGANSFSWQVGGTEGKFLFSVDDRVSGGKNPTESRFPGAILPGRQYTTVVQVRNEGVIAFFEGKQMAAYKTDYRDLRVDSWHVLPDPSRMAVCCDDPTVFHVIELTEVTGKGKKVREGSK